MFWDRVSLYSPGCPGTHSVDQAGLELRNPPASASQVLGLKVCTNNWPVSPVDWGASIYTSSERSPEFQISLQMVVSHHVVAGIWTLDLRKSSRVLLPTEPSHQPRGPFSRLSFLLPLWVPGIELKMLEMPVGTVTYWAMFLVQASLLCPAMTLHSLFSQSLFSASIIIATVLLTKLNKCA